MILILILSSGTLFGGDNEASSSNTYEEMPNQENESKRSAAELLSGARIFLGHYEPKEKRIHHTYEPQIIRHEKANLLEQAAETAVQVSTQTIFGLLAQDVYIAGKNFLGLNGDAESMRKLRQQQAQNKANEEAALIEIQTKSARLQLEKEALIIKLFDSKIENATIVNKYNQIETERSLTNQEEAIKADARIFLADFHQTLMILTREHPAAA